MANADPLVALAKEWRDEGRRLDAAGASATYAALYRACADDLDTALSSTAPQPGRLAALELLAEGCLEHPAYRAKRPPRVLGRWQETGTPQFCSRCMAMWETKAALLAVGEW